MPVNVKAELVKKEQVSKDIYKFTIKSAEIAKEATPGQFLEIRVSNNIEPLLRRPISIYNIEKELDLVEFIFQSRGKGTTILADREVGETLDILGPLGNGTFDIKEYKNVVIIGGGIGIFPLHQLAKQLHKKSNINIYLGFRNKECVVLEEEFKKVCNKLEITTDDGTYGKKGYAIDLLKENCIKEKPDIIFACGPLPMSKAIRKYSIENKISCQISLEEKMACGIGACLGCAVKIITEDSQTYKHVCKDGPVFYANEVDI